MFLYGALGLKMRLGYECGCSVEAKADGFGGIDASFLKLCDNHREEYDAKKGPEKSQQKD